MKRRTTCAICCRPRRARNCAMCCSRSTIFMPRPGRRFCRCWRSCKRPCTRRRSMGWRSRMILAWGLTGEESGQVHEAIQVVAVEGLTLLWPDLDRLVDAEDSDIAHLACEAIERLREDMDRRRG